MNEINISKTEKEIIEMIKEYLSKEIVYPEEYKELFFRWSLINPLYNEYEIDAKGEDKEAIRVAKFGKKYNNILWNDQIRQKSVNLIKKECVGKGRDDKNGVPELYKHVIAATRYLRNELNISTNICVICRKKDKCKNIKIVDHTSEKLGAIMRIVYQIRCNLFHGDKSILNGDEGARNLLYVELANEIMKEILHSIKLMPLR